MADLRFKQLTAENWQEPDSTLSAFARFSANDGSIRRLSGDEWAREILAVGLSERVPVEVRRLFAVARGALVYGYFFYPLYTLGAEQLFRLAETSVNLKCRDVGLSPKKIEDLSFNKKIDRLVNEGALSPAAQQGWRDLWQLRNLASHPDDQSILPPGTAIGELRRIAVDIDGLFEK